MNMITVEKNASLDGKYPTKVGRDERLLNRVKS